MCVGERVEPALRQILLIAEFQADKHMQESFID